MIHRPQAPAWAFIVALIGLIACAPEPGAPTGGLAGPTAALGSLARVKTLALPPPSLAARPTQRVLTVKLDYQDHRLSCEAAALKMALAYEGIAVDELTLIGYMSRDSRPARRLGRPRPGIRRKP